MLALHVAIRPGVALFALLVVTSAIWVCLLVEGLEMLLAIWIYWWLPLLVRIVRVARHLSGGMALAQQKLV
jgi:multisubunit Na+/H+ antiporter MnhB subunit